MKPNDAEKSSSGEDLSGHSANSEKYIISSGLEASKGVLALPLVGLQFGEQGSDGEMPVYLRFGKERPATIVTGQGRLGYHSALQY